jgi:hypothetical protein
VVREEAAGGCAALAVSRVVGGAGEARLAREEAEDGHERGACEPMLRARHRQCAVVSGVHLRKVSLLRSIRNSRTPLALTVAVTLLHHLFILLIRFFQTVRYVRSAVEFGSIGFSSHSISWGTRDL